MSLVRLDLVHTAFVLALGDGIRLTEDRLCCKCPQHARDRFEQLYDAAAGSLRRLLTDAHRARCFGLRRMRDCGRLTSLDGTDRWQYACKPRTVL
jgi:hypothetical protein